MPAMQFRTSPCHSKTIYRKAASHLLSSSALAKKRSTETIISSVSFFFGAQYYTPVTTLYQARRNSLSVRDQSYISVMSNASRHSSRSKISGLHDSSFALPRPFIDVLEPSGVEGLAIFDVGLRSGGPSGVASACTIAPIIGFTTSWLIEFGRSIKHSARNKEAVTARTIPYQSQICMRLAAKQSRD
jgi:hypothetical protein